MKSIATGTNSARVRASRSRQSWMNSFAMIPHSRLVILLQGAELVPHARLALLVHERDEEVLHRRLHLARPRHRASASGEQTANAVGVGAARGDDHAHASANAHDLLDRVGLGQDIR